MGDLDNIPYSIGTNFYVKNTDSDLTLSLIV